MTTTTVNYTWKMPDPGGSANTWGDTLNGTTQAIDAQVFTNQQTLSSIQGQINPNVLILKRSGANPANIFLENGDAAAGKQERWVISEDIEGETGGSAGSNLTITPYDDAGNPLPEALVITRSTQRVSITKAPVGPNDVAHKGYVDAVAAPIGSIMMWPSGVLPASGNWSWCGGAAISRTTYSALWAIAQTSPAFGPGDGSTTFNLPNMFGRSPLAYDGAGWTMGETGGEINHMLGANELPVHAYTDSGHIHTITDPQHFHTGVLRQTGSPTAGVTGTKLRR